MPAKKKDDEITVVAYLEISWDDGAVRVRKFDRAWAVAQRAAKDGSFPIHIELLGWIRKDDAKPVFVMKY